MENASDALIMAFAIFIFITALSLLFYQITMVKDVADIVFFHRDITNFYTYEKNKDTPDGKIVDKDVVVSTLYKCAKDKYESIAVVIQDKNGVVIGEFDLATVVLVTGKTNDEILLEKIHKLETESDKFKNAETFIEKHASITISGKYLQGDDGTQITLVPGGKKTIIVYTIIDL